MMRTIPARSLAAAMMALGSAPALAQGTAAEREACTPDALRLCSDTIPDIPKTTACMKAHQAQLSSRCRAVIVGRADPAPRSRPPAVARRIEREAPPPDDDGREQRFDGPRGYGERDFGGRDLGERDFGERDYGDRGYGERRYLYVTPRGEEAETPDYGDRARARAEIGELCDEGRIDPRTCALTDRSLR